MNQSILMEHLEVATGVEVPKTANGKSTTSVKEFWNEHRTDHPLIDTYCSYTEMTKLRTFFSNLTDPVIRPKYRVFVRSGRTSCSNPNVQQLPRGSHIRETIIPSAGHLLFAIDYSGHRVIDTRAGLLRAVRIQQTW